MTALRLVAPPPGPASNLATLLATYRAKVDYLAKARARLQELEVEEQQAARAVHVAAAGRRVLIAGDVVVYVEGTEARPVVRVQEAEVVR